MNLGSRRSNAAAARLGCQVTAVAVLLSIAMADTSRAETTTKPPGKGTGLGLNISHTIVVEKHHGRIDIHSQPGSTTFEVRLPLDFTPNIPKHHQKSL